MSYTQPTAAEVAERRAQLAPFDGWNERAFAQIVAWQGLPGAYLDLGSGTGAMVNMARKMGVEAWGVDLINGPEHWFLRHDLTQPLNLIKLQPGSDLAFNSYALDDRTLIEADADTESFPLITCLEVAEHLPEDTHRTLVESIARHMPRHGILVFSAAPPGQAGEHHVGCRPAHAWRSLFYEHGVSYREDYTRQLAHLFGYVTGPSSHWLAANLQVYDR